MLKQKFFLRALLGCALLPVTTVLCQPDTAQALLDLLVKKGLVTRQEASELQEQARANAAAAVAAPPSPPPPPAPAASAGAVAVPPNKSALAFKIGSADFTPVGFLDFTSLYRNRLDGGDVGSGFGSIPYSNTANGRLSETRFSAKNSRLGLRVDSAVGDTQVLGYLETDFLGNQPTNINVASNSDTLRMRVFFVDLKNGPWEFLAGQDWSMLTPNRKGLSPLPSDIFFTQDVDTNYQVGLVWGRTPQVRAIYHASDELTFGISAENPDQYVGSAVVLPAGFNGAEVDNGSNGTATPNLLPDLIAKVAFDTKLGGDLPFHADAAALYRYFKINTFGGGVDADATANGYGGSVNMNVSVLPHLQLIENAFASKGGGRYLSTGLAPDFIVTPPDATGAYGISPVYSWSAMAGAEWDVAPSNKLFGYYGIVDDGRKSAAAANGSLAGYGFAGSPNTNNRKIEEYTLGDAQVLWKNAAYGDLKVLTQLSYLSRTPWYVAPNGPSKAGMGMLYLDLRYDLP